MSEITKQKDGGSLVPDVPTMPFIIGDGVGAEITPAMQAIVNATVDISYDGSRHIEWKGVSAGERAFRATDSWLPDETMEASKEYLIDIKGPLTIPVGGGIRSLNVTLRQTFDLHVYLRPVRWFRGVAFPVKEPGKVNMHIFCENMEDTYVGIEWEAGTPETRKFHKLLRDEVGVSKTRFPETSPLGVKPVSHGGTECLVRATYRYTLQHELPSVTPAHKGSIIKSIEGGLKKWGYGLIERELSDAIAPGKLVIKDCIADTFLQNTLLTPEDYSATVILSLNGDYISDQLAAIAGGTGITPEVDINYDSGHAIFEATHGTVPNIVGKGVVNSCSLILLAVMTLEYLGWQGPVDLITETLEASSTEKKATNDPACFMYRGRPFSTSEFTEEIINRVEN